MDIKKGNILIANFLGFTLETNLGYYDNEDRMSKKVFDEQGGNCYDELLFDKSMDWLNCATDLIDRILENVVNIGYFDDCLSSDDIEVKYQAVIEFIEWNNLNQNR